MSDVFISYAREDRDSVETLAAALGEERLSVWWDRDMVAGDDINDVIQAELNTSLCVIVVWSTASVKSQWVRDEAGRGHRRGALLPVRIEEVDPPLPFGQIHTVNLVKWDGDRNAPEFKSLANGVRKRCKGTSSDPPPPAPHVGRLVADEIPPPRLESGDDQARPRRRIRVALGLVTALGLASIGGLAWWNRALSPEGGLAPQVHEVYFRQSDVAYEIVGPTRGGQGFCAFANLRLPPAAVGKLLLADLTMVLGPNDQDVEVRLYRSRRGPVTSKDRIIVYDESDDANVDYLKTTGGKSHLEWRVDSPGDYVLCASVSVNVAGQDDVDRPMDELGPGAPKEAKISVRFVDS